jgi:hypothetical protein
MNFISILLFLLKYGPAIFEFIKAAIDLIKWLRKNDDQAAVSMTEASVKQELNEIAKRCKKSKDMTELREYVANLQARKEEIERHRRGN